MSDKHGANDLKYAVMAEMDSHAGMPAKPSAVLVIFKSTSVKYLSILHNRL